MEAVRLPNEAEAFGLARSGLLWSGSVVLPVVAEAIPPRADSSELACHLVSQQPQIGRR